MKETCFGGVTRISSELMTNVSQVKTAQVTDDDFDWDVQFTDEELQIDHQGHLLTALVRQTYVDHVHKSLLRNYKIWFENYGGGGVELSEEFIGRCASDIEKKALRACMLTSLYQHSIASLIKGIKKSTESNKLYEDLLSWFNVQPKKCDKGIQTDPEFTSSQSPVKKLSLPIVDSTLANVHSTVNTTLLSQAIDNIIFDADITQPVHLDPPVLPDDANSCPSSKYTVSYLRKNNTLDNGCSRLSFLSENSEEVSSSRLYDPEIDLSEERLPSAEIISPKKRVNADPKQSSLKRRKMTVEKLEHNNTLEERLKKFEEIFGDKCEDVQPASKHIVSEHSITETSEHVEAIGVKNSYPKIFSLVSWKQESVAQTCELNRLLQMVSATKLSTLESCFQQLFGTIEPIKEISAEDFSQCRKRLAHLIVYHLTPYFEDGRISNREVFKALARELTRIILNNTYAADLEYSHKVVEEIFINRLKYQTIQDVSSLIDL